MNTIDDLPLILAVDDEPGNLQLLNDILGTEFRLLCAKSGERALKLAAQLQPALILLDVMMPGMDGYEVCRQLKNDPATAAIPVIFVTAMCTMEDELRGFAAGAVDFVTKPVSLPVVLARVRAHLTMVHLAALKSSRLHIVQRLGRAAEYKDNETGMHVMRMSRYAQMLALAAGLDAQVAEDLMHAAPMHDIGKIGIPDSILKKPGKLDEAEWEVMKTHAEIGADIIGEHPDRMLTMAREIALSHHEKYDGSGYPHGLAGDKIPLTGRITAVADVFDALTSARPYKQAWSFDKAFAYLLEQRGRHFDPALVDLFVARLPEVEEISRRWSEAAEADADRVVMAA
jgi:putative two-component system response regulator